jgi:5-formyltetrahydrofolate cyclo-ligase
VIATKQSLRTDVLKARAMLDAEFVRAKSRKIAHALMLTREFQASRNLLIYLSLPQEVQTDEIIAAALASGKTVHVPLVCKEDENLQITVLESLDVPCKRGELGVREPEEKHRRLVDPGVVDLVVTPGLVFDKKGGRVGYGGGYFDRLFRHLSQNVRRIALAFDFQVVDKVPQTAGDAPMHMLITEERTLPCR